MKRLTKLCNRYGSDKGTVGNDSHGFSEFYEQFFEGLEHPKILELGVRTGAFEKAISDFYDGDCDIYCVDIDNECKKYVEGYDNIAFFQCDCGNEDAIKELIEKFGDIEFDVVIDDASHYWPHQFLSLLYFRRKVKDGGIFIMEDLHSSYENEYSAGIEVNGTPLAFISVLTKSTFYSEEENTEILTSIKESFLYTRYNPKGLYGKDYYKRSVTAVLKIDKHGA